MSFDTVIRNGTVVDGTGLAALPRRRRHRRRPHRRGSAASGSAARPTSTPKATSSRPASSTATRTWTPRCSGTRSARTRAGTASPRSSWATAASRSRRRHPTRATLVVRNLERAEDISGRASPPGIEWTLDRLRRVPRRASTGSRRASTTPPTSVTRALRTYVMGERAFEEQATDDDLAAMTQPSSTTPCGPARTGSRRRARCTTRRPTTVPSRHASRRGTRCARWSRSWASSAPASSRWSTDRAVARRRRPTGCSSRARASRPASRRDHGHERRTRCAFLDRRRCARPAGACGVSTHPRGIGAFSSFRSQLPFDRLPEWRELRTLPIDEQRRRLEDPDVVARLVKIADEGPYAEAFGGEARPPEFDRMQVFSLAVAAAPDGRGSARLTGACTPSS